MGPMILVSVLASVISGQVMARTGRYKALAVTGSLMMFASMLLLSTMTKDTTIPGVLSRMFLFGIGMGLMMAGDVDRIAERVAAEVPGHRLRVHAVLPAGGRRDWNWCDRGLVQRPTRERIGRATGARPG